MAFFLNQYCLVSALENVTYAVMIPIKFLSIYPVKLLHSSTESTVEGFNDKVVVIIHEAVGMTNPIEEIAAFRKDTEKHYTILVIAEDFFSIIAARSDVIHCSGKFNA